MKKIYKVLAWIRRICDLGNFNFLFPSRLSFFFLKHIEPHLYLDRWSSLPLNGQSRRLQTILGITDFWKPDVVIETGTYLGSSTPFFASISRKETYTIEISYRYFRLAKKRFMNAYPHLNIKAILGDSKEVLPEILKKINPLQESVLAYLDAHWYKAIPTMNELEALIQWGGQWIAIIDDFEVPGDTGYSFDVYGQLSIGMSMIPKSENFTVFLPIVPSSLETGARRGTGYLVSSAVISIYGADCFEGLLKNGN